MAWPIAEVARISGVTARTLRHYDEIGLLPPARIGANGRRHYEERQLLQLQQILVLRALGVGLVEIGRVLAEQVDELEALRGHHRQLLAERDRLDTLAATVARTITELERSRKDGTPMTGINRPENLFEGIRPARYMKGLRDFPELVGAIERHNSTLSEAEIEADERERTTQMIRLPSSWPPVCTPTPLRYRRRSTPSTARWPGSGPPPPRNTGRSGVHVWRTNTGAPPTSRSHRAWPRTIATPSTRTPPPALAEPVRPALRADLAAAARRSSCCRTRSGPHEVSRAGGAGSYASAPGRVIRSRRLRAPSAAGRPVGT